MVEHIELLKRDLKHFGQVRRKRETETHARPVGMSQDGDRKQTGGYSPGVYVGT